MAIGNSAGVFSSDMARGQAESPIDLAHLRRFTMGDEALEVEILGLFAEQLPITIAALREAETEKAWGIAAHTLKGSARAVGAWALAAIAETAEHLRPLPDAAAREDVIARLEAAAGSVQQYIASLAPPA